MLNTPVTALHDVQNTTVNIHYCMIKYIINLKRELISVISINYSCKYTKRFELSHVQVFLKFIAYLSAQIYWLTFTKI